MMGRYEYTAYVWPIFATAAFLAWLAVFAWRRRSVPGAVPFTLLMGAVFWWAVAAAFELMAADAAARIFWYKFQAVWPAPAVTAALWFALEYANLNRWLTRPVLAALWIFPLLVPPLILTNEAHHWLWLSFAFDKTGQLVLGPAGRLLVGYGYVFALAASFAFAWLFVHSPPHRWPAALCLVGHAAARIAFAVEIRNEGAPTAMDLTILAFGFTAGMYAVALFRFHMFDLIPIARGTLIQQMSDGMIVVDARRRIVDLNPAAQRILGVIAGTRRRKDLIDVCPGLRENESELVLNARRYALYRSELKDRRGLPLGYLILLHDVTEEKQMQKDLLQQQRAVATLRERDRIARELHDSIGQVLAFVKMQAEGARELLTRDQLSLADSYLARMIAEAHEAHADVREYILGARVGMMADVAFLPALERYVRRFTENYGIPVRLTLPAPLIDHAFEPRVGAELLRIIQEALTNVRKHAQARNVDIRLGVSDGSAEILVKDDGAGCDPHLLETAEEQRFGLRSMRERAADVGGSLRIESVPGAGTMVTIRIPMRQGNA